MPTLQSYRITFHERNLFQAGVALGWMQYKSSHGGCNLRKERPSRSQVAPHNLATFLEFPPLKIHSVGSIALGPKGTSMKFSATLGRKPHKTL